MEGNVGHWHAIVEDNAGSGQYARWRIARTVDLGPDRAPALAGAQQIAATYNPPHPWRPQWRQVYEHGEDGWLVVVVGSMSTSHFRVSLVRLISQH
ncbi:hypothetical protein [Hamadaea tsunoensis]|uniref:hypothetical protein n=1 Tax=Hamadaea tsunoensis TaxID=53368 RepID=UPI0003F841AE|nr:hypothetical protein [Hamadaea tsunoensis]